MITVKKQYIGMTVALRGGRTFIFPIDGSNPYNEKIAKKYPEYFNLIDGVSSGKPPKRRKPRKTANGRGENSQGAKVGKMGARRQLGGVVSSTDSGDLPKLENVEGGIDSKKQLGSVGPQDGKSDTTKEN